MGLLRYRLHERIASTVDLTSGEMEVENDEIPKENVSATVVQLGILDLYKKTLQVFVKDKNNIHSEVRKIGSLNMS